VTDNKEKRGIADRTRINVNEEYELRYQAASLDMSRAVMRRVLQ
jgi:hypothetical protein